MKISLEWLSSFVTWKEKDVRAIADRLTLAVAEVEEVEVQGALLEHCCVGKILKISRHPNADRLSLADVETDRRTKRVVCGGTNLREGMLVAFAHVGATVRWHGTEMMTLAPVKIRGEASEGMICAAEELDLAERFPSKPEEGEHPIIDMTKSRVTSHELRVGAPLRETLGLNDTIFHISNTAITHRPDLFSHIGFARECVATGLATWKTVKKKTLPKTGKLPKPFPLRVDIPTLVPRYCSCIINVDGLGETPPWMKRRLEATGWRPVSLPVDITNYVAMETGMPLHCFDAADIQGTIRFRLTDIGESITTLDGVRRELPEGAIVLSDDEGIFDLMGVMGGLRSSTKDTSRRLYLHAAAVDPIAIRRTILATGHRTEAATVYEKGIPPVSVERGFQRALELFLELLPGAALASTIDSWGSNGKAPAIPLSLTHLQETLGTAISEREVTKILTDLECTVKKPKTKNQKPKTTVRSPTFVISPPLHRLRDLKIPMDLVEEVARLHGYDRVSPTMPLADVRIPARDKRLPMLRDTLKEEGFTEIVPLSLLSPVLLTRAGLSASDALKVQHPLSEDTSVLQPSTLPQLLAHAERNLLNAGDALQTFHCSHVFDKHGNEHTELSALLVSTVETSIITDPFLVLKRSLAHALAAAGYELSIAPSASVPPAAHPGRVAALTVGGTTIGSIFEIHPTTRALFDLPHRAAAATLHLPALLALPVTERRASPVPVFPSIVYDFTVTRTAQLPLGPLLSTLKQTDPLLESVVVHDLYSGAPLKPDEYNVTLRCTYRSSDRTLTEEEAKEVHGRVMTVMQNE